MNLLLAEELIVLSIDKQTGGPVFYDAWNRIKAGIPAAILMELALMKRIFCRHGMVLPLRLQRTGDEYLDRVLLLIARAQSPKSINFWISQIPEEISNIEERAITRLVDRGILGREMRPHKFGIRMHYPLQDPKLVDDILERIRNFALQGEIKDYHTYTLLYLIESCEMGRILETQLANYKEERIFALIEEETRTTKQYFKEMLSSLNDIISRGTVPTINV